VCWVLCALAYAEMGAMIPETGGHYVYLRECYGPLAGFLCGWTFALVVLSAAMAWLAVSFSITLGYFVGLSPLRSKLNCAGVDCGRSGPEGTRCPYHGSQNLERREQFLYRGAQPDAQIIHRREGPQSNASAISLDLSGSNRQSIRA